MPHFFGGCCRLASGGLVIPLGGTSNHFRRSCLEEVGGWDAYNVTEDADLGVRLARFGYRIGVITRGTIEDAPVNYDVWRKAAHGRQPYNTWRELGWFRFTVNQIYTLGVIGSALLHPFMLVMFFTLLVSTAFSPLTPHSIWLLALDVMNILMAYVGFYLLGSRTMEPTELGGYV